MAESRSLSATKEIIDLTDIAGGGSASTKSACTAGSTRSIVTEDAASFPLLTLDPVYGECVQNGTPTPDAPVYIQTVRPETYISPHNHLAVSCSNGNTAYLDMTDPSTGEPVELYGLDDTYRDILTIDASGHAVVEKRTQKTVLDGTEAWYNWDAGRRLQTYQSNVFAYSTPLISDQSVTISLSSHFRAKSAEGTYDGYTTPAFSIQTTNTDKNLQIADGSGSMVVADWKTWLGSNNVTIIAPINESSWYTIDLGYIDLPVVSDGSTVYVAAEVQPQFCASWWTTEGEEIKNAIDDLNEAQTSIIERLIDALGDEVRTEAKTQFQQALGIIDHISQMAFDDSNISYDSATGEYIIGEATDLVQSPSGWDFQFETLRGIADAVNDIYAFAKRGDAHIKFTEWTYNKTTRSTVDAYSVILMYNDSATLTLAISKYGIYFQNGPEQTTVPIAYIDITDGRGVLKIANAQVWNELQFGASFGTKPQWAWYARANGNMSLKWIG